MRTLKDRRLYWRGRTIWCRVPDVHGRIRRETTRCTDETAASAFADRRERQFANPHYAAAAKETLAASMNAYFDDLNRRGRSDSTKKIARQKTGHFARIWGLAFPMERVLGPLVLAYMDTRYAELREGTDDPKAGELTVKMELRQLRQMLVLARFRKVYFEDIDTVIPPFINGSPKKKTRAPSFDELRSLLAQFPDFRAAHLAWYAATGGRLLEGFRARRCDVDFDKRVVFLRGSKTEASAGQVAITVITEPLLRWALDRAPGKDVLFRPWGKLHRDVEAACRRAGIAKVTPNDLRRAFGHWHRAALMASGTTDKTAAELVSKLLRHTTDKLAQITYANLDGAAVGAAIGDRLDRVSGLYALPASETQSPRPMHEDSAEKAAPSARVERATNALGTRSQSPPVISGSDAFLASDSDEPPGGHHGNVSVLYRTSEKKTAGNDPAQALSEEPAPFPVDSVGRLGALLAPIRRAHAAIYGSSRVAEEASP